MSRAFVSMKSSGNSLAASAIPSHMIRLSKTHLAVDIADVVTMSRVPVDFFQIQCCPTSQGEPAKAVVDLFLYLSNRLSCLVGHVEEAPLDTAPVAQFRGKQVDPVQAESRPPRPAQGVPGRLQEQIKAVRR